MTSPRLLTVCNSLLCWNKPSGLATTGYQYIRRASCSSVITPEYISQRRDYEFLDAGEGRRLERFGDVIVDRTCPNAFQSSRKYINQWTESNNNRIVFQDLNWKYPIDFLPGKTWEVCLENISFELSCSQHGQIGIFPEQQLNWRWIPQQIKVFEESSSRASPMHILNCFGYTGGSSIASLLSSSNIEVTHVDASKAAVTQCKRNWDLTCQRHHIDASQHPHRHLKCYLDDCLKVMERFHRRGMRFEGIIVDPPAFGRGPHNERWVLRKDIVKLMELTLALLADDPAFLLFTCHDESLPPNRLQDLAFQALSHPQRDSLFQQGMFSQGTMNLVTKDLSKSLPMGSYFRWGVV